MDNNTNSNPKENWKFNLIFAIIITFTTLGLYLITYIIIQTIFLMNGNSNSVENNIYNIKITLLILIPVIFFQLYYLSWKGKFAEKIEFELNKKEEENKLKDLLDQI